MKYLLPIFLLSCSVCWSQAPGGVSANLKMWVKSDAGVGVSGSNVISWTDQTAINTFSVTGTPQLISAGLNYIPSIQFNGSSRFTGNTTINNTTHGFAVGKIVNGSGISGSGALIGNSVQGSGDYFFHTEGGTLYAGNPGIYTGYNTSNTLPFNVYSEDFGKTPAASDIIRINGANTVNNNGSDPIAYNRIPTLGSRATENLISGSELVEAILYDASLSSVNTSKIESYLSIKYGITLNNAAGGTAGDYISSGGTVIWDADNGSGYHNSVMGIARDDNSAFLQKRSHQADDSTRIYLSSLQTTNAANTGSFSSDAQFVMIGHNNQALRGQSGNTEFPSGMGIYNRLLREWKITNTNFAGTFSLDIKPNTTPITATDLRILIDDDGNFTNATMFNPAISYAAGVITVSGISTAMIPANATRYFTIASLSPSTPLPVGLIQFTAVAAADKEVRLNWQTAYENNNAFFAIERSGDNVSWQEIARVNAMGAPGQLTSYVYSDKNPLKGILYYRLRQTDLDGHYTYSDTRHVRISYPGNTLTVYPNPAWKEIVIGGNEDDVRSIRVFDMTGRIMSGIGKKTISSTEVKLDLTHLAAGIYLIKTNNTSATFYKQ